MCKAYLFVFSDVTYGGSALPLGRWNPLSLRRWPKTLSVMSFFEASLLVLWRHTASDDTLNHCTDIWNICHEKFGAPSMTCLSSFYSNLCVRTFDSEMTSLNSTRWCNWGNVKGWVMWSVYICIYLYFFKSAINRICSIHFLYILGQKEVRVLLHLRC